MGPHVVDLQILSGRGGAPIPKMDHFVHIEYVDNFVALSQEPTHGAAAAKAMGEALNAKGLVTHPVKLQLVERL
jgi:hypothetical protein